MCRHQTGFSGRLWQFLCGIKTLAASPQAPREEEPAPARLICCHGVIGPLQVANNGTQGAGAKPPPRSVAGRQPVRFRLHRLAVLGSGIGDACSFFYRSLLASGEGHFGAALSAGKPRPSQHPRLQPAQPQAPPWHFFALLQS